MAAIHLFASSMFAFYGPLSVRTLPAVPMSSLKPAPRSRDNDYGKQFHALRRVIMNDAGRE